MVASRQIYCKKLKKQAEGLTALTYPGDIGKRIYLYISKEAWQLWLQRQTMIINEYRLNAADAKARKMLEQEMVNFLFEEGDSEIDLKNI